MTIELLSLDVLPSNLVSQAYALAAVQGTNGPQAYRVTLGASTGGNGLNVRGAWAANTAYAVGDVVTESGSSYVVTTAFTSGASFDATNLTVLAQAGAAGATGATGATGPQGPAGSGGSYTLPTASTGTLGGVKVDGTTVVAAEDGTLSVSGEAPGAMTSAGALIGTDLATINRAGVDYKTTIDTQAEYARTPVAPGELVDTSGTIEVDLTVSPLPRVYDCPLTGTGRTLTVNGTPVSGQTIFRLRLTGSGTITTYPGPPKWRGGTAPTLTGRDEIVFERVGSEWWASAGSFS